MATHTASPPALRRLAAHIILRDFGPVVETVADLLISRFPGSASLKNIVGHCDSLEPTLVRTALLILMQHNLIHVSKLPADNPSRAPLAYSVRLFDITKRLHFVLYSSLANDKYGPTVRPLFRPPYPLSLISLALLFTVSN